MVFVSNVHILVCILNDNQMSRLISQKIWKVFNVKDGTLVDQKCRQSEPWSALEADQDYEIACTDYSNLDDPARKLIVLRNCLDQSQPSLVVNFNANGQMKTKATIEG